jgi:hypothetical protein
LEGRDGLKAANRALMAQYAPNIPKTTLKIAVLLSKKAAKSALTSRTLARIRTLKRGAANI